jgi:hypothetical protein
MKQILNYLFKHQYLSHKEAHTILPILIASDYTKSKHLPTNIYCTHTPINSVSLRNTRQTNIDNFFNR